MERTGIVRRAYVGRTQYTASTWSFSSTFLFLRFSRRFVLTVSSRLSSDSRIVRESPPVPGLAQPGWKPSHLGCPRVPASRQAGSPWMEAFPSHFWLYLYESGSSETAWFRRPASAALLSGLRGLRFVVALFFRGPGADALGHTGFLLRYSEQEVLFPEGSQVMIKELLKACPFSKAPSTQLNPRSLKEAGQSPRTRRPPN